jgi:hypothetical protein
MGSTPVLSVASCTLPVMDDDSLATVIPFPTHRVSGQPPAPPEPDALAAYWALVQRLAAERRDLGRGAG